MTRFRPLGRRPDVIRAAVAKSRESRLRAIERGLNAQLDYLHQNDRDGHDALVDVLKRVLTTAGTRGGAA